MHILRESDCDFSVFRHNVLILELEFVGYLSLSYIRLARNADTDLAKFAWLVGVDCAFPDIQSEGVDLVVLVRVEGVELDWVAKSRIAGVGDWI